jgi:hypothetical protein
MTSPAPGSSALSDLYPESFISPELSSLPPPSTLQSTSSMTNTTVKKRPRTSWVWQHMPGPLNTVYFKEHHVYWRCQYCPREYKESGGTTIIANHLKTHDIFDTQKGQRATNQQLSILTAFQHGEQSQAKRRRIIDNSINPATLKQVLVRWIARCSVSFRMIERSEFRDLLYLLNPDINTWLPTSHVTIQNWTMEAYQYEKLQVQQALQSAQSKIHFTIDLWTSVNNKALMGIVAHYLANNGDLRESVLAFRELEGQHTGNNQSRLVISVVEEYGIASKVGYFIMDNAENNETMIRAFSSRKYFLYLLITY